jgi:hypothetical protein
VEASEMELRLDVVGRAVKIDIASAGSEHTVRLDVP